MRPAKRSFDGDIKLTVSAEQLRDSLNVTSDLSDWFRRLSKAIPLVQGADFVTIERVKYLSFDAAIKICRHINTPLSQDLAGRLDAHQKRVDEEDRAMYPEQHTIEQVKETEPKKKPRQQNAKVISKAEHERQEAEQQQATPAPLPAVVDGSIDNQAVPTVNARELHAYLEIGKDFSNWIKDRIDKYGFVENQDFIIFAKIGENSSAGRPSKEYFLTLDMAKELSMVERNEKGKQARQYFIQCERKANQPVDRLTIAGTMNTQQLALLMQEVEEKERYKEERDQAVKARSQISSSREASMMAQVGHLKREVKSLKEQLEEVGKENASTETVR